MRVEISPVTLKGEYFTVKQFAMLTNRSPQTIYNLVRHGNSIRRLKGVKIETFVLIPAKELEDFPFTNTGRYAKDSIYHYSHEGEVIKSELEELV